MAESVKAMQALIASADEYFNGFVSRIDDAITAVQRGRAQVEAIRIGQTAEVSRLQQENSVAGQAIRERTAAEKTVERLTALEVRRDGEKNKLRELLEKRRSLKADYLLKHERISTLREEVAADLQRRIGESVRLRVLRNADNLAYQQMLLQGLRGARVRNHDDILAGLMRLRPEQVAQIIQDNDVDEFEELLSFGRERSSRILEAFRASLNPLEVEVIEIEDRIAGSARRCASTAT